MEKIPKSRPATIFIFLVIISVFLFLINLVVHDSIGSIFSITSSLKLQILSLALLFMSGGFVLSIILGSYYYNAFTRKYYMLTAVWMGFLVYLFLFSAVYGFLFVLFGATVNFLGAIFIIVAVFITIYGVFHARDIKIKKMTISLKNLPKTWRDRKAIWISDLHLGQIYSSSFTKQIVEKINLLPHDIIFIGGDLYDGTQVPDLNELISPLKDLVAPLGIYFITGNHEEFGPNTKFINAIKEINIRTLIDESIEIDGLQIIGVDYYHASNKDRFRNILSSINIQKNKPAILLKHEPKHMKVANDAGINFQISGHTHQAQLWPLNHIAGWIYKKFVYGFNKFENMAVYTSSGVGTWGPPMRVGTNSEIVLFTFM